MASSSKESQMPIRVIRGISNHFPSRNGEWWCAYMLAGSGFWLLYRPGVFLLASYSTLAQLFDQEIWGAACFFAGMLRILALIVNGTLYDIPAMRENPAIWARVLVTYSRYSPHVRAVLALLSCLFWFTNFLGVATAGALGPGIWLYSGIFLADLWNASRAGIDADKVARNVPA